MAKKGPKQRGRGDEEENLDEKVCPQHHHQQRSHMHNKKRTAVKRSEGSRNRVKSKQGMLHGIPRTVSLGNLAE